MKFILGTKEGMVQVFDQAGRARAATVILIGPLKVTALKTKATDGYEALQVGYGELPAKRIGKSQVGKPFARLREVRLAVPAGHKLGDVIEAAEVFKPGDNVTVAGVSKGKGFQGVVKRHGFAGGPRTHGQKHSEREPGSIGGGARAGGRVARGMRMAGRMGNDRVTMKNLPVLAIEGNKIMVGGAVPGRRGTVLEVKGQPGELKS